jgi:general secretion pathway protein L
MSMDCLIIQVADEQVTVARFAVSKGSAAMNGSALFALDEEHDLAEVASRIASGISGTPRIVLCLPPALLAQRAVEIPLNDPRKVREVLPTHLQGEIALPVESVVFDCLRLSEGRFLALWAQRADIARYIGIFTEAGVEPAVVSAAPLAWPFLPGIAADCALYDGTTLAIVTDGRLSLMRTLSGPEREKQLALTLSALDISSMALPPCLFVFGEQAGELPAPDVLPPISRVETLHLPDECARLFRNEQIFHQLVSPYAVALALRSGALPDFRRGDLAWTAGNALLRKQLRLTAVLAIVLTLLLFIAKGVEYQAARRDIASLDASIFGIYHGIFPNRARAVDEVAEIKGEIRKLTGAESSSAVLDPLRQLAEVKGAGINGLYEAELEGRSLRLKGDARSVQAVNEFRGAMAPLTANVELGEVRSRPDGGVTFSMAATLREGRR